MSSGAACLDHDGDQHLDLPRAGQRATATLKAAARSLLAERSLTALRADNTRASRGLANVHVDLRQGAHHDLFDQWRLDIPIGMGE